MFMIHDHFGVCGPTASRGQVNIHLMLPLKAMGTLWSVLPTEAMLKSVGQADTRNHDEVLGMC